MAFNLNLYKPDRKTPIFLVISSCRTFSSNLVRAISLAPTELPLFLLGGAAGSSKGCSKVTKIGEGEAESGEATSSDPESLSYGSYSSIELSISELLKSKRPL